MKSIDYDIKKNFSPEGLDAFKKIVDKEKRIDYKFLRMKPSSKNDFDFRIFMSLKPLFNKIYFGGVLIPAVEREQDVFDTILEKLKKHNLRAKANIEDKTDTLTRAQNFYDGREMIINAFKNKLFPFYSENYYKELEEESSESENEESSESEDEILDISTSEQITMLDKFYGSILINKYFIETSVTEIINKLKDYQQNPETLQGYKVLLTRLIIGLERLENDINDMSENDVKSKQLDYLKDLVRKIVDANQKLDDMPDLEPEEKQQKEKKNKD